MQADLTASFWPRLVRTLVISSIATIAFLRMTTTKVPVDVRGVDFNLRDHLLPLSTRSALLSSRRNSRLKAQHGKQSKLRISKRSQPSDRPRKSTRASNAVYEIHLVNLAQADPSNHFIHIATFHNSFDFRSTITTSPESGFDAAPDGHYAPRLEHSQSFHINQPIFTLPYTYRSPTRIKVTDLPNEVVHMIFEQLFDPTEMSTHGRLSAFESASQVCSAWRSIILNRTFKLHYQLQKDRWRFDEFKWSPWEASFIYLPSWQLYHRDNCARYEGGRTEREDLEQRARIEAEPPSH